MRERGIVMREFCEREFVTREELCERGMVAREELCEREKEREKLLERGIVEIEIAREELRERICRERSVATRNGYILFAPYQPSHNGEEGPVSC